MLDHNSKLQIYALKKKNITLFLGEDETLSEVDFAIGKIQRYEVILEAIIDMVNAYNKLFDNDFDLPKDDPAWGLIDENPEFYEDVRGKKLRTEYPHWNTKIAGHLKDILHDVEVH